MFIAHLPAGYMMSRLIQHHSGRVGYTWVGLLASVLPDFDLLYFYLVDSRHLHHTFLPHLPFFWLVVGVAGYLITRRGSTPRYVLKLFMGGVLTHMALDSIAAPLFWFYPFSSYPIQLIEVPARFPWWVWNFLFHWSFLLEIIIVLSAVFVWKKSKRHVQADSHC